MPGFFSTLSSRHLKPPPAPSRKPSERLIRTEAANDVDDFLSSDFEHSFASTMSLNSPPCSPPAGAQTFVNPLSPNAMDISPAPPANKMFKADHGSSGVRRRPRAFTVARMFGRDVANQASHHETASSAAAVDDSLLTKKRSALPQQWLGVFSQPKLEQEDDFPPQAATATVPDSDAMDIDDDNFILPPELTRPSVHHATSYSASTTSFATFDEPTVTLNNFASGGPVAQDTTSSSYTTLFYDAVSPSKRPRKRRSLSPEASPRQASSPEGRMRHVSEEHVPVYQLDLEKAWNADMSSSPAQSSPSMRKIERSHTQSASVSAAGGLFGKSANRPGKPLPMLGVAQQQSISVPCSSGTSGVKRPRRPALAAHTVQASISVLDNKRHAHLLDEHHAPRRAFSATISQPLAGLMDLELDNDEPESEANLESSPAAQALAKRQLSRNLRRKDGTDDFKPIRDSSGILHQRESIGNGLSAMAALTANANRPSVASPLRKAVSPARAQECVESPSARWLKGTGMPGFGDNEAHGKTLPCEKVSEDGLMRITTETMDALLSGAFDDRIASYQVIDCRFDYEYQGGHIRGAVNVNTTAEIEDFFLGANSYKPTPTCSGDTCKKNVLVFHCEFSAKRAPTFAKHLRAKDRALNHHVYPRIHYPEVYILKGGYSAYYNLSARFSEPRAYVRMDDPQFARDRRQDLDAFRVREKSRFGRTRSYAYGELGVNRTGSGSGDKDGSGNGKPYGHQKRNTAPTASSMLLPPAELTRMRKSGSTSASNGSAFATLRMKTSGPGSGSMGMGMGVPNAFASLKLAAAPEDREASFEHIALGDEGADVDLDGEEEDEGAGDESYLEQKHGGAGGGFPGFGRSEDDECINVKMLSSDAFNGNDSAFSFGFTSRSHNNRLESSDQLNHFDQDHQDHGHFDEQDQDQYQEADESFNLNLSSEADFERSPCPPPLSSRGSALGRFGMGMGKVGGKLDFGVGGNGMRKPLQRAQTFAGLQ